MKSPGGSTRNRRRVGALLASVSAALLLAACGGAGAGQQSGGAASSSDSTQPTTSSSDSTQPTTSSSDSTGPTTSPSQPVRMLSDSGFGALRLGMSLKQAQAAGLVGPVHPDSPTAPDALCTFRRGKGGVDLVYFVQGRVSIIAVGEAVRTDRGIGVEDTYRQVHAKYPDAQGANSRVYAAAPGAPVPAQYRFGVKSGDTIYPDDRVTDISLQALDQACYE